MTSSIRSIRTFIAALCALTMVAWLAVPAMADDHGDDRGNQPDHAGEQGRPDHAGEPGEPEHAQGATNQSEQAEQSRQDEPGERSDGGVQAASASDDAPHGHAHGHGDEPPAHGQDGAPPEHAQGEGEGRTGADNDEDGDPNRGTVKVRDGLVEYDGSPRHEPHIGGDPQVGCDFTIHFLGFDEDEGRDFWLYLHAPTDEPHETLVHSGSTSLGQAQGNELSASVPLSFDGLDGRDLFTEENHHPQQGWKMKLTVDGPKHKVFWINCPIEAAGLPDADMDVEDDTAIAAPVDAGVVAAADDDEDEAVLAGAVEADDDEVIAATDQLPVTGGDIALIALLGLLLAGLGTAALRLNRGGESVSG